MDLIITMDYELYGDGSGDVFTAIINPTNSFLDLCRRNEIKATIFFEVLEYIKLSEEWKKGNRMGYHENPAEAIENQIIHAFKEGHDIQLHIHPQWINAKYENNRWALDHRYWRLPNVPLEANSNFEIGLGDLIKLGKRTIEGILKPFDASYRCIIFRAGGFNIFPSQHIIPLLRENGFIADSSVYAGAYEKSELSYFDYRNISHELPYWWINDSVTQPVETTKDFLEVPVFAKQIVRIKKYDENRIRIALKNKKSNFQKIRRKVKKEGGGGLYQKIRFFLEKEALTWDYCLFSNRKMNRYLKLAKKIEESSQQEFHPFVLVGHSKEFLLPSSFEKFISENRSNLKFLTLKAAVVKIYSLNK